jgi:hypothetical protein
MHIVGLSPQNGQSDRERSDSPDPGSYMSQGGFRDGRLRPALYVTLSPTAESLMH